jgi:hypothetical protein
LHGLPPVPATIPQVFGKLIQECWRPNPFICFQEIVIRFLKNELSISLTGSEAETIQAYQAQVLAPQFATCALMSVFDGLDTILGDQRALEREVDELKQTVNMLYRSFRQVPPPSQDLPRLPAPIAQLPGPVATSEDSKQSPVRVMYDLSAVSHRQDSVISFLSPSLWANRRVARDWFAHTATQTVSRTPTAHIQQEASGEPVRMRGGTHFPFNCGTDFAGILTHMARGVPGQVVVSGNSCGKSREASLAQIVDFTWKGSWLSENRPNSWIQIDFLKATVCITDYTIKTYPVGPGFSHLKSWVIEGSTDGQWVVLDAQKNNNDLNGKSLLATFRCSGPQRQCSSFKLRQTGPNHHDDNYLCITNIEFYGVVFEQ